MKHLVRQSNKLMQNISTIDVYILTSPSVLFSTVRFLPAWWISGLSLDIVHRSIFCDIQLVVGVQKDPFQFVKIITCCARSYAEIMSVNSFQTVGDSLFFSAKHAAHFQGMSNRNTTLCPIYNHGVEHIADLL